MSVSPQCEHPAFATMRLSLRAKPAYPIQQTNKGRLNGNGNKSMDAEHKERQVYSMTASGNQPTFLAVDFYCGAGGTTRGLIDAGGYVIAGIDKETRCQETYQSNNQNERLDKAEPEFIAKDMFPWSEDYPDGEQAEIMERLRDLIALRQAQCGGEVPLLFAVCAPCQSFTKFAQPNMTAERIAGRERDRGLIAQAVKFIQEFKPDMVLSENVAGIGSGGHAPVWKSFRDQLLQLEEYRVGSETVNASDFGVPQHRRRAIIMAVKTARPARIGMAVDVLPDPLGKVRTVREAIGDLPRLYAGDCHESDSVPNHRCQNLSDLNIRRLKAVNPGEPNYNVDDDLKLPCHRRLDAKSKGKRGFGDVYTRVHPDLPAPTITTRFYSVSNGRFGHYEQDRGLSLREGALLQSFPLKYKFHADGMAATARMIGNAVPPRLAEELAKHLCQKWSEENFPTIDENQGVSL